MCDNLDDEKRKILKKEDNKRKKEQLDHLSDNEKEQLSQYENMRKKEKKLCMIILTMNKGTFKKRGQKKKKKRKA